MAILFRPLGLLGELGRRCALSRTAEAGRFGTRRTHGPARGFALALLVQHLPHRLLEGEPAAEAGDALLAERMSPEVFRPHAVAILPVAHGVDRRHLGHRLEDQSAASADAAERQTRVGRDATEGIAPDGLHELAGGRHHAGRRGLAAGEDDCGLRGRGRLGRDLGTAALLDRLDDTLEDAGVAEEDLHSEARELRRDLALPAENHRDLSVVQERCDLVGGLAACDDHGEEVGTHRVAPRRDQRVDREAEAPDQLMTFERLRGLRDLRVLVLVGRLADLVGRVLDLVLVGLLALVLAGDVVPLLGGEAEVGGEALVGAATGQLALPRHVLHGLVAVDQLEVLEGGLVEVQPVAVARGGDVAVEVDGQLADALADEDAGAADGAGGGTVHGNSGGPAVARCGLKVGNCRERFTHSVCKPFAETSKIIIEFSKPSPYNF